MAHFRMPEDHHRGAEAAAGTGFLEDPLDVREIVSVAFQDGPAESFPFAAQVAQAGDVFDAAVDLLMVPVGHGDQVVHIIVGGRHRILPDLAFLAFTVTNEDIDGMGVAFHPFGHGRTEGHRQALAQRTGRLVDARQVLVHRRMTLEAGAVTAEGGQFSDREIAPAREQAVEHGGNVAGREEELVKAFPVAAPVLRRDVHFFEKQVSEDIRGAHRAARMPRRGRRDHTHDVPPDL